MIRLRRLLPIALALATWWALGLTSISSLKLPRWTQVGDALLDHWQDMTRYSLLTFARVAGGLAIGAVTGWGVGLLMMFSRRVRDFLEPLAELLRPIPPIVLVPFIILWLGLGNTGQILLIALGSFMVLLVSTFEAAAAVPRRYILAAQSLGASRAYAFVAVIVPAIRPHLIGPIRVAAGSAFGLAVAGEYMGAQGGLGYVIRNARVTLNTETMMLASLLIGAEAVCLDILLRWLWRRWTGWAETIGTAAADHPDE